MYRGDPRDKTVYDVRDEIKEHLQGQVNRVYTASTMLGAIKNYIHNQLDNAVACKCSIKVHEATTDIWIDDSMGRVPGILTTVIIKLQWDGDIITSQACAESPYEHVEGGREIARKDALHWLFPVEYSEELEKTAE